MVSVLDSGAEGPGFKSQSRRCRVTVLGKLFTIRRLPGSVSVPWPSCTGDRWSLSAINMLLNDEEVIKMVVSAMFCDGRTDRQTAGVVRACDPGNAHLAEREKASAART